MSETQSPVEHREERLARYLRRRVAEGDRYFKSKYIADDLGMTASEIGAILPDVGDRTDLSVERWGYSGATTWRVATEE